MKEKLLVDYLEDSAEFLGKKKEKLRELRKEYEKSYGKDIREEMEVIKEEIKKKKHSIVDHLYENAEELRYLKRYFPDFFEVLLEDEEVGEILKKKDFLYEERKGGRNAHQQLAGIDAERRQLRDAEGFLNSWHGAITEKQLTATYPVLKGRIKGNLDASEAINEIKKIDRELRKEGWKIIVGDVQLLGAILEKFINKMKRAEIEVKQAEMKYEDAKGRGSVTEYSSMKILKRARTRKEKFEKIIKHLLLINPEFLSALKKRRGWLQKTKRTELEKIAEKVTAKKVKERTWLDKMNKKLS